MLPLFSKNKLLLLIKFVAFIFSLILVINLTNDYLDHHYQYSFSLSYNVNFKLPKLTICTERNVFFDKRKVLELFKLTSEYEEYLKKLDEEVVPGESCTINPECHKEIQRKRNNQANEFFRPFQVRSPYFHEFQEKLFI